MEVSGTDRSNIVRARVEDNRDPLKIGRIKVRVGADTGVDSKSANYVEPEGLPWASPCIPGAAGFEYGNFNPPPAGSWVWLMWEDGDTDKPVYIGGAISGPREGSVEFNDMTGQRPVENAGRTTYVADNYRDMGEVTIPAGQADTASEIFNGKPGDDYYPHRIMVYKSPKGAMIMIDETDGEEGLVITDRVGQVIKFVSPVPEGDNQGNGSRRTVNQRADLGGQVTVDDVNILIQSGKSTAFMSDEKIEFNIGAADILMVEDQIVISVGGTTITLNAAGIVHKGPRIDFN